MSKRNAARRRSRPRAFSRPDPMTKQISRWLIGLLCDLQESPTPPCPGGCGARASTSMADHAKRCEFRAFLLREVP